GGVGVVRRGGGGGVLSAGGAGVAGLALGAGLSLGDALPVWLGRVRAGAVGRIAAAGVVALVERGADDGVRSDAGASLAGVGLGAGVTVGAGAAVTLRLGRAGAVGRIAAAGVVALVEPGPDAS